MRKSMADKTTYVYFIQSGYGAIKVGVAKNPESRMANMQTSIPKALRLLAKFPMPDRQTARNLEQDLHKAFASERIRGEWFNRRIVRIGRMKKIFAGTLKQPYLREGAALPGSTDDKEQHGRDGF
jgi:predicted GIY-YIG superfamily endonuclease